MAQVTRAETDVYDSEGLGIFLFLDSSDYCSIFCACMLLLEMSINQKDSHLKRQSCKHLTEIVGLLLSLVMHKKTLLKHTEKFNPDLLSRVHYHSAKI